MTENHNYDTPSKGATDWHLPLNRNFADLDTDVEVRDVESNRDSYTPKQGAKFLSTDSGAVYLGDGSQWNFLGEIVPEQTGGGGGGGGIQFPDAIVWKDGGTTVATARDGSEIASGSNPSPVIEEAIRQSFHVQIIGDYVLTEKIFLDNFTERTIDAAEASFSTNDAIKLWEFNDSNWCRFRCGLLDCGQNGLIGLDLHGTKGITADIRFNHVTGGTFTENDGIETAEYDKCAVRLKSFGGQKGCYYNRLKLRRTYTNPPTDGKGVVFTNTKGHFAEKPNGNLLQPIHWNSFDTGIQIKQGFRNTILQSELGARSMCLEIWEGPQTLLGDHWMEGEVWGIHVPDETPNNPDQSWRSPNPTLNIFGGVSFGAIPDDQEFKGNSKQNINWLGNMENRIYLHSGFYRDDETEIHTGGANIRWDSHHDLDGNMIKRPMEGSTGSDPTSQSPDGWMRIDNVNGETRFVPYYT